MKIPLDGKLTRVYNTSMTQTTETTRLAAPRGLSDFAAKVAKIANDISAKYDALDPDGKASLEDAASLDMGDWLLLGDKASRGLVMGVIDADTAQVLHAIHTAFHDDATLGERVVFIQAMGELLPQIR